MHAIRLGGIYFLVVFLSGVLINTIRTLELLPQIGSRAAALVEAAIMFGVILIVASAIVHRSSRRLRTRGWLTVGAVALVLLLSAGYFRNFGVTGIRPIEYIAAKDWTTRFVFVGGLAFFTLAPCLVYRMVVRGSEGSGLKNASGDVG